MEPNEVKEEGHRASWQATLDMRDAIAGGGIDWACMCRAMYNAGRAYALYQARDVVETLEGKLKDAKAKRGSTRED